MTCTFTNTQRGSIIVAKETLPDGSAQGFEFSPSWGDAFTLADGQSNDSGLLEPGEYSVGETVPEGWDLASATCDDGSDPAQIGLDPGETVTCTFSNTQRGAATALKLVAPDGAPGDFTFVLTPLPAGDAVVSDPVAGGGQADFPNLVPGRYQLAEQQPTTGFDLTDLTCDPESAVVSIDVDSATAVIDIGPGQTVTCTFTNTQRGSITVAKETLPDGSAQTFEFSPSWGPAFSLADGQSNTSDLLVPGEYSVGETVPAGWDLTSATCDDGSDPTAIGLDPGETVTCTFTNTRLVGAVSVVKALSGATEGYVGGSTFDVTVTCDSGTGGVVVVSPSSPAILEGIPTGSVCTVVETALPEPVDGFSYGDPSYTPSSTVLVADTGTVEVVIDNPLIGPPDLPESGSSSAWLAGPSLALILSGLGLVLLAVRRLRRL